MVSLFLAKTCCEATTLFRTGSTIRVFAGAGSVVVFITAVICFEACTCLPKLPREVSNLASASKILVQLLGIVNVMALCCVVVVPMVRKLSLPFCLFAIAVVPFCPFCLWP